MNSPSICGNRYIHRVAIYGTSINLGRVYLNQARTHNENSERKDKSNRKSNNTMDKKMKDNPNK